MMNDPRFGAAAQTSQQRAWVLQQLQAIIPGLKTKATPYAQQIYARYVGGELSWPEVRRLLNEAAEK
jgi:hypothetical protein